MEQQSMSERENLQFTPDPAHLYWQPKDDFSPYSLEACCYTAGDMLFLNEGIGTQYNFYLMEFFSETKKLLVSNRENDQFRGRVGMQLSGHIMQLERAKHIVWLEDAYSGVFMKTTWREFLEDFSKFQSRLRVKMERCFPRMSSSPEFKILF